MPRQPISLNLALIAHRLATDPRGWREDLLRAELNINARTYRKYRRVLQLQFMPFRQGRRSLVTEVREGNARWLRLVAPDTAAPGFSVLARVAAHHLARTAFGFLGQADLSRALADAATEFDATVASRRAVMRHLRANLDRLIHVVPDAPKNYGAHGEIVNELLRALVFLQRVRLRYRAPGADPREHVVEPLTLVVHRGALYLLAQYPDSRGGRPVSFAVERALSVERLSEHYPYPARAAHDPAKHYEDSFGVFVNRRACRLLVVELVFARIPWLHAHVRSRRWTRTQKFTPLPDGRLRMVFRVNDLAEVIPWVRQWGDAVTVRKPTELAGAVRPRAGRGRRTGHS